MLSLLWYVRLAKMHKEENGDDGGIKQEPPKKIQIFVCSFREIYLLAKFINICFILLLRKNTSCKFLIDNHS